MNKHIVIIEPVSSGEYLPEAAKKLNCYVTAFALNVGILKLSESCLKNIDELVEINVSNESLVREKIIEINRKMPISVIISGFEFFVPLANRLSWELGLPCNDINWVEATRYKHLMAENFSQFSHPSPRSLIATNENEALKAGEQVGYPCIIKPSDGIGSCDVYKVTNKAEMIDKFSIISNRPPEEDWRFPMLPIALIQEFIDGEEISVETIVSNGEILFSNVTDKIVTNGPCFVELGHVVPSAKNKKVIEKVLALIGKLHKTMGIRFGATHTEVRIVEDEPKIIEIAARLPGGKIPTIIKYSTGVDLWEATILSYLGQPLRANNSKRMGTCVRFLTTDLKGEYFIKGLEEKNSYPDLLECKIPNGKITISGKVRNYADRHGHIIVSGENGENALKKANEYIAQLMWISA